MKIDPINVEEFMFAARAFVAAASGAMPLDDQKVRGSGFIFDGQAYQFGNTPLNRGMFAALESIGDDKAKRHAFSWRYLVAWPCVVESKKFAEYVDGEMVQEDLILALCTMEGDYSMRPSAIVKAVNARLRALTKARAA